MIVIDIILNLTNMNVHNNTLEESSLLPINSKK